MLHRDIDDLEQWTAGKVIIADSNEQDQDFEHVELLKERFQQFSVDTQIGKERVNSVSQIANSVSHVLIDAGHADSSLIAQWNKNLNSTWEDLLELIRTRTQMLQSSWELQKFFSDRKEFLTHIDEKKRASQKSATVTLRLWHSSSAATPPSKRMTLRAYYGTKWFSWVIMMPGVWETTISCCSDELQVFLLGI